MPTSSPPIRYRIAILISLAVILPLGYWVRFSQGPLPEWLNDGLGSVAYEMAWILFVILLFPTVLPRQASLGVCCATCAIEFLQLWQPPLMQAIRATVPGRLVLGNTFNWFDFLPYFIGSFMGWIWLRFLRQRSRF